VSNPLIRATNAAILPLIVDQNLRENCWNTCCHSNGGRRNRSRPCAFGIEKEGMVTGSGLIAWSIFYPCGRRSARK
jgi:hypothetical protein